MVHFGLGSVTTCLAEKKRASYLLNQTLSRNRKPNAVKQSSEWRGMDTENTPVRPSMTKYGYWVILRQGGVNNGAFK